MSNKKTKKSPIRLIKANIVHDLTMRQEKKGIKHRARVAKETAKLCSRDELIKIRVLIRDAFMEGRFRAEYRTPDNLDPYAEEALKVMLTDRLKKYGYVVENYRSVLGDTVLRISWTSPWTRWDKTNGGLLK